MRLVLLTVVVAVAVTVAGCSLSPQPLTLYELSNYAYDKRDRVTADQEPLSGPLGLFEAMARALKYNLDKRVELMQVALRGRELRVAHYSLLPELVANNNYNGRDNYSGGNSVEILAPRRTGEESLQSSTSSDRDVGTFDLAFSWHILDFGLSYIRAQQAADNVLIANEAKRRVVHRIIEDVRAAYWKVVTATRLESGLEVLADRVEAALADTRALSESGDTSPLTALTYERELYEIQREIRRLQGDLATAKAQLAALVNVDPGDDFSIIIPSSLPEPRYLGMGAESMIHNALQNRSELREVAYKKRINFKEARAAILEMLPGISLNVAPNYDTNAFLFNQHWVAWGAKASWNLIKVFNYRARAAVVTAQDDLLDQRALAVTMAIMTQVHVSRARLIHARRQYRTAQDFFDVQVRIRDQIRESLAEGKVSEQTAIREEMNTLVASVKVDLAYVDLQSAFANVYASMGTDPYEEYIYGEGSVEEIEEALRYNWRELGDRLAQGAQPQNGPRYASTSDHKSRLAALLGAPQVLSQPLAWPPNADQKPINLFMQLNALSQYIKN